MFQGFIHLSGSCGLQDNPRIRGRVTGIPGVVDVALRAVASLVVFVYIDQTLPADEQYGVLQIARDRLSEDYIVDGLSTKSQPVFDEGEIKFGIQWNRLETEGLPPVVTIPHVIRGNRCSGTTLTGRPCRNKTRDASGRCWRHVMA